MKRKFILLDRDGTLIVDKIYLNSLEDLEYLPNVFDALKLLQNEGYEFAIVTNQSGVPRGLVQLENLHRIHDRIREDFLTIGVEIAGFYFAPHMPETDHPLRKPNPGMLLAAAEEHNIDLPVSWMVGDRMTDVEAGRRAGCRTVFMGQTESPTDSPFAAPDGVVETIMDAAKFIVNYTSADR